jgi:hypothetical protein
MANGVYNRAKYMFMDGTIDLPTVADLRVLLVKDTYTFNPDHNFVSDVVAGALEISVAGYARQPLTTETITEDDALDFAYLDADDPVFTALVAGQTIGGAVLFKYNVADAAAEAIAFYDTTDTPTNGGNVTIQWATPANGGVLKLA